MFPVTSQLNFFNLSSSFRRDSSIHIPYGQYGPNKHQHETLAEYQNSSPVNNKKKLAVWIVSHCNADSHRDAYFEELSQYMPLEKFGKCSGIIACSKERHLLACEDVDLSEYKFYISAENSICKDYVTGNTFLSMIRTAFPTVEHRKS